jgi:hypothetical protein
MNLPHGAGAYADPDAKTERWGGRKAQAYVELTIATYGDLCINCGLPGSDSADHIIPRADGGAVYDIDNLGPSHRRGNFSRGRKPLRPGGIPVESGIAFFKT